MDKKLTSTEARKLFGELTGSLPGMSTFASWIRVGFRGRTLSHTRCGRKLLFTEQDVRDYARHLTGETGGEVAV